MKRKKYNLSDPTSVFLDLINKNQLNVLFYGLIITFILIIIFAIRINCKWI